MLPFLSLRLSPGCCPAVQLNTVIPAQLAHLHRTKNKITKLSSSRLVHCTLIAAATTLLLAASVAAVASGSVDSADALLAWRALFAITVLSEAVSRSFPPFHFVS